MKKAMIILAVAALTVSGFAQAKPKTKKLMCPVMPDHAVNLKDAKSKKLFVDYKNKRYYVCCAGCIPAFKADPAKFAAKAQGFPIPKKGS